MSFFAFPSSSSSSSSPPSSVEAARSLRALPADALSGMQARGRPLRTVRKNNKKLKANQVASISFNTVASRPQMNRLNNIQVYSAYLTLVNNAVLTTSTVAPTFGANGFSLGDFVGSTQYTGLFDQYRIDEFEVWLEPNVSQSTAISNVSTLVTAVDVDDATAPTTIASVQNKQNALQSNALDGHYHRWAPHIAMAAYGGGVFTSFANEGPQWIDSASPSVVHYGIKYAAGITSVSISYTLNLRAKLSFRQAGI